MTEDEKKVSELESALEAERGEFTIKLNGLIPIISKVNQIPEAQVLMLSYRHMLVDKMVKYRSALHKKKSNDQNYRKIRYEYYKTQHDVRLDYREINQFVDSDMSLRIRQSENIENQINFYSQCIETLDKMGFAIKNRLILEEINERRNL
jgi:hypothetical protein